MSENFNRVVNRLLADTEAGAQPKATLRARLAADLAEGLTAPSAAAGDDLAAKSAFLEGRLTGVERDAFVAQLANDENLRADMESARALVDSVAAAPVPVPAHLLQQALAQPQAAPARAGAERRSWLAWLPQGSRLTWAAAAAALLLVVVPGTVLLTGDQLGWWGDEEQLSASPAPDIEPPKSCEDAKSGATTQQSDQPAPPRQTADGTPPDQAPEAPCPSKPHEQDSDVPGGPQRP